MPALALATVVAKNYWSFARVLAESIRRFHPDLPVFVLLSDEIEGCFDPAREPFSTLHLADLGIPDLRHVCFRSDRKQLAITAKPFLLSHLLERGFESAIFFDPDILVLHDLGDLFSLVRRHPVVLVPHLLRPLAGPRAVEGELKILLSGVYNGGFVGISADPTARRFLSWWRDRVLAHCEHDVAHGMHYDQRWLDLAPVFFPGLHILRDSSCNLAYWNVRERDVTVDQTAVTVFGQACRFFHFSGFDPGEPDAVTRHLSGLTLPDLGPVAELFRRYRRLVEAAGYGETRGWPYAYGRFDNGVEVSSAARRRYRELGAGVGRFGDPFETAPPGSFFRSLRRREVRRAG